MCQLKRYRLELCRELIIPDDKKTVLFHNNHVKDTPIYLIEARKRDKFSKGVLKNDNHYNITESLVLYLIEIG
jgi:hypothetical protein